MSVNQLVKPHKWIHLNEISICKSCGLTRSLITKTPYGITVDGSLSPKPGFVTKYEYRTHLNKIKTKAGSCLKPKRDNSFIGIKVVGLAK